jgi:hypothetical protein
MPFSGYILDLAVVTGFELGGAAVTKRTVRPLLWGSSQCWLAPFRISAGHRLIL